MSTSMIARYVLPALAFAAVLPACSGDDASSSGSATEAAGSGGELPGQPGPAPSGAGGNSGVGGVTAGAGSPDDLAAGGSAASGGTIAIGGNVSSGGGVSVGGSVATGGAVAAGGNTAAGGNVASGGEVSLGGSVGSGGDVAAGGAIATAGNTAAGGNVSSGGTVAVGGAAGAATTVIDECDTTAECVALYGSAATDCVVSQSDESWCACGGAPCDGTGTGGTPGTGGAAGAGTILGHRVAFSSDGNHHDTDDIPATALSLMIMAKLGVGDQVVHYDHSDHIWESSAEREAIMADSVNVTAGMFPGEFPNMRVYNGKQETDDAIFSLVTEIDASGATAPLTIIGAGPMEIIGRAVAASDGDKRQFVTLVSHSSWNDNHADTEHGGYSYDEIIAMGVLDGHIADQNGGQYGITGNVDNFTWLRDHWNPEAQWLWERNTYLPDWGTDYQQDRFDASDAGMAYFVASGGSYINNEIFRDLMGYEGVPGGATDPNPTTGAYLESGGVLIMEPENVELASGWIVRTDNNGDSTMNGFTGSGFLEWAGAQAYGNTQTSDQVSGIMAVTFEIQTAGIYTFRWRSKQYTTVASGDAGNDSFVRFASGTTPAGEYDFGEFTKVWVQSQDAWSWQTTGEPVHGEHYPNQMKREYTAGTHTIQLAGRSPGHAIDRIVLHHSSVSFDEGTMTSAAESVRAP